METEDFRLNVLISTLRLTLKTEYPTGLLFVLRHSSGLLPVQPSFI